MTEKFHHCKAGEMKIYQIRNIFSERKKKLKKTPYRLVVSSGTRVCPQAFFFEHKNTKMHLSCPKKGAFSCFDVQGLGVVCTSK